MYYVDQRVRILGLVGSKKEKEIRGVGKVVRTTKMEVLSRI